MGLRIRPGWSLALILLIAFALQLIAVLSVPVTKKIFLCEFGDYQFGVFGYCNTKTGQCSSVGIGYDISSLDGDSFALPSNARKSLANLLIVHVVAAGLTLILLVFSLLTCIHGPANSSRYLLFVLIFSIPAFLISLLAFLVDILLFVSHLSWGGWIVLAATVLLALTGIILCVMRRSLSSRKAMRRRGNDDELADMSFPPAFQNISQQQPHEDQFTELKYQNSTSVITATNTNDDAEDGRYQHSYQPSVTESYRHANQRAFRGQTQSKQSLISHERQPEGQFPPRVPLGASVDVPPAPPAHAQLFPAGTYPGEDNVSTYNLPVGNSYGPNVVGIPRLREDLPEANPAAAPLPPAHGHVEQPAEDVAAGYAYAPDQQQQRQEVATQGQYGEPPASPHYSRPMNPPMQRPQRRVSGPRDVHDQQQQQQQQGQVPVQQQHSPRQSYVPPRRQWNGQQQQVPEDQRSNRSRTSRTSRQSEYRPYFNENTGQEYEPSYSPEPQYNPYQQPQSQHYQQQPQAYQPTRSEMIIGNNPDFQVAPVKTRRKGPSPIPQPINATSSASSTSSKKRRSQVGGAPAAFATNDGPFAIARGQN